MLFPVAKVRYRVRCRNTFAGYARNFWWNGAGLMRGMQCMEKRVVLSHVGSYEYELVKVRIYDLTGLFYVHKKIKRFADIQVLPELDAVAGQGAGRGRRAARCGCNSMGRADPYAEAGQTPHRISRFFGSASSLRPDIPRPGQGRAL